MFWGVKGNCDNSSCRCLVEVVVVNVSTSVVDVHDERNYFFPLCFGIFGFSFGERGEVAVDFFFFKNLAERVSD